MTRRLTALIAGGCALLLGMSLSGCAAPSQSVNVSDPNVSIHFWVPRGWHQVDGASLTSEMKANFNSSSTWSVAYGGAPEPKAADILSFDAAQPFVLALSGPLNSTVSSELSYQMLRDSFLPVTSTARQTAVSQGFQATGFRPIRDQVLNLSQGVHGVRETYDYTLSGETDTFDSDTLTNAQQTTVFFLVIHCTTVCYSKYRTQIDHIMSSLTVSGFWPAGATRG